MRSDTYDTMPAMLGDAIRWATLGLLFAVGGIAVPERWTQFFVLSFLAVVIAVAYLTADIVKSRQKDEA